MMGVYNLIGQQQASLSLSIGIESFLSSKRLLFLKIKVKNFLVFN